MMTKVSEWLGRWIRPVEEKRREDNVCHCGTPMIRLYSLKIYRCFQCDRDYRVDDGVEIVHQR